MGVSRWTAEARIWSEIGADGRLATDQRHFLADFTDSTYRGGVGAFGCTIIPPVVVLGPFKRIVLVGRRSAATGGAPMSPRSGGADRRAPHRRGCSPATASR
jgi:hypothetical protein